MVCDDTHGLHRRLGEPNQRKAANYTGFVFNFSKAKVRMRGSQAPTCVKLYTSIIMSQFAYLYKLQMHKQSIATQMTCLVAAADWAACLGCPSAESVFKLAKNGAAIDTLIRSVAPLRCPAESRWRHSQRIFAFKSGWAGTYITNQAHFHLPICCIRYVGYTTSSVYVCSIL